MNNIEKNGNITVEDFILVEENFLPKEECNNIIDHFHFLRDHNLSYFRNNNNHFEQKDEAVAPFATASLDILNIDELNDWLVPFNEKFQKVYDQYDRLFDVGIKEIPHNNHFIKIQKTEPGEGYHIWHCENNSSGYQNRICAWILYLNDVEEGGETEFLFQKSRVKPKTGTFILWPGGFTHPHRGNPPLTGTKYVMTGWTTW